MCFSANTSFTTSAIIFSAGTYATFTAIRFNRHYITLALVPILFSIQQVSEGFVWITMGTSHVNLLHSSILTYLFFAFLLWPAYFPFCFYYFENISTRKTLLMVLTILGLMLGGVIYIPLLIHVIDYNLTVEQQSLAYSTARSTYSQYFYTLSYALIIFLSAFVSSKKEIQRYGFIVLISFLISTTWFLYAFVSVWCYFAAFLSVYIAYMVHVQCVDKRKA